MDANQVGAYIGAVSNPERTLVDYVKGGNILDDERKIEDGENVIKVIRESWIPDLKEGFETAYHHNPQYPESEDGLKTLKQIETFKSWIKLLKQAIVKGKEVIEKQQKIALEKEAVNFITMHRDNFPKSSGDREVIAAVFQLSEALGERTLEDLLEPVLRSRKLCKIAKRNLARLKEAGIKDIPENFPELGDPGLEDAFSNVRRTEIKRRKNIR